MNEEVKHVFLPGPMVSFRSVNKSSSYLVRSQIYPLNSSINQAPKTVLKIVVRVAIMLLMLEHLLVM